MMKKLINDKINKQQVKSDDAIFKEERIETKRQKMDNLQDLVIINSTISLYSSEQMKKIASVDIKSSDINKDSGDSVNDLKMGVASENYMVQKCNFCQDIDCPGHYGLIDFGPNNYIYNPSYIRVIVSILTCVCNSCGALLINEEFMKIRGFFSLKFEKRLLEMSKLCMQSKIDCTSRHVKQSGDCKFKILKCSKNPTFVLNSVRENGYIQYKISSQDDNNHAIPIPITTVKSILECISVEDSRLMGFTGDTRPVDMILNCILVPPVIARPPVYEGNNIHYDQLTHKYSTIVNVVEKMKNATHNKDELLSTLYNHVKSLIFKSDGNKMGTRDFISIIERIQGKTALLRALLMGKRVDFCGRTVAGPDPSLKFGQIRLPKEWESVLTKKMVINDDNREYILKLFEENKIKRYKAKFDDYFVINKNNIIYKQYNDGTRKFTNGDIVERFLQTGDRVTVNRQPTLHKQSLMAYDVVLGRQSTIGLHLSYTSPMNCDFDGDENNVWVPQDLEVEAEAEYLINVKYNIMSSEQNKPIMGLVMNSISGAYILSNNIIINKKVFIDLLKIRTNTSGDKTFLNRLLKYNIHPYSGNSLFSSLLPEDFYYNEGKGDDELIILEGILVKGKLKKDYIGASHNSIIQVLHKNYGTSRTVDFFTDAPRVINKWLMSYGFSVGMKDMYFTSMSKDGIERTSDEIIEEELVNVKVLLELNTKQNDATEEYHRQRKINEILDVIKTIGLKLAKNFFNDNNSLGIMTDQGAGAKGASVNIGQMIGSVGQQNYKGERLKATLTNGTRLLPIYDENDESPEAHAFIPESYFKGVSPSGLFFQQAGGREGLLDTALKTAETGSMQHKMIKAFENIVIAYDGSVRHTTGTLYSPVHNSGYDVAETMKTDGNITSFINIDKIVSQLNLADGWVREKINKEIPKKPTNIIETDLPSLDKYLKSSNIQSSNIQRKITKFEKARIIGTRAIQIANNDKRLGGVLNNFDPVKIAETEYNKGVIPLYIIRKYPDNSYDKIYPTLENI